MTKKSPHLIIFAGANGSGKTTLARVRADQEKNFEFINADEIAKGLSPFNSEGQKLAAGKLVLKRRNELLQREVDFAIETTLSGISGLEAFLKKARDAGYLIKMYYIHTRDVRINLRRIKERVKQEGHNVPEEDVRRRYKRSIHNLFKVFAKLCDVIYLYDNSEGERKDIAMIFGNGMIINKPNRHIWNEIQDYLQTESESDDV